MHLLDYGIIAGYLLVVIGVGIYAGRRERGTDDFFVGGRSVPWLAVLGSIVATEVSAATFLAVPGVGYSENMSYLQFGIGSLLARFFVAGIFLTAFYRANCVSIYEYLGTRFGNRTQYTASVYFVITRLMASGVRLLIAASGLAIVVGIPLHWSIIGFSILALLYTGFGGIKAVIWTDCIQGIVFIGAGIAALLYIGDHVGWTNFLDMGTQANRFHVFNIGEQAQTSAKAWWNNANWFWIAIAFGFLSTTAAMGTDQDMTQRMLTCRNAKQARWGLILSGFIALPIAGLFLTLGIGLWAYFQKQGDASTAQAITNMKADAIFPYFIAEHAPYGLRGLLIAGVLAAAMSSLDSAMAALSSSTVKDLLKTRFNTITDPQSQLRFSRAVMFIFAILLGCIAWLMRDGGTFLWLAFKVTSISYGALLGIFLLGLLSKRGRDTSNLIAMLSSSILCGILLYFIEHGSLNLAWTWLILIGTTWTYVIAFTGGRPKGQHF